MDVKSAFLYGTIEEDVYVCQPPGFQDPDYLDKEKIDQTLFIKKKKGDILLVRVYVDDIIFRSTNKDLCKAFEKLMKDKFQMSSMGELTFFLGLQVKQKQDGIFISQDKYVAEILRKFGLTDGKSTSTPIDTEKPLLKDSDGEDVDVHTYRSMIGSLMYLTSSRPDIMFIINAVSSKLMLFGLTITVVHLMLLGHKTNDVVRLQALIDRRKVIITEDTVRQALRLDDVDSIDCLPNEEIFAELARMGYEKPSTKLTFYKAFLSAQWKFLIHTILQCMSAKRTSWNEFSSSMDSTVICLAIVHDDVADDVANADAETTPLSPTPATTPPTQQELIPSSSQVESTLPPSPHQSLIAQLSSPLPQQPPSHDANISMALLNQLLDTCATLTKKVGNLEQDKIAQAIEITKLKQRVRRLKKKRKLKASRLKRLKKKYDKAEPAEVEEVLEVVTTAKLITEVVTTATTPITVALIPKASAPRRRRGVIIQDPKEAATTSLSVQSEVKTKDKGKGIIVEDPKPLKRQAQIEQDEAFARELEAELDANINWNELIDQIEEEDGKRKGKNLEQEATKKQKIDEEVEELKTHLQIVPNDEDYVYTEATTLAFDYQIHHEHNKPYYKIIIADGTHQLFLSFITLLKNFDREDLEMLWKIVQEKFAS
uniref:Copia protein n=1 Tax=Tanacetum cinerariifolium TaxID=118510 RepID=A0A6L2N181_TANCI|nr:copia protein [Tanacetum cinerariifolium]